MIERHFHWKFTSYNGDEAPPATKIHWPVTIEVIGYLSEADAHVAAKDILTRDHYQLMTVYECAACGFQQQQVEAVRTVAAKMANEND